MSAILSIVFAGLRGALPLVGGFFTGGFSWVWSLFSAFIGTEIGSKIVIGVACILGGFVWGFSHEHAVKESAVAAAVSAQNAEWTQKINDANAQNEQRVQEALNAARNTAPVPNDRDNLVRMCQSDPSCRSAISQGQHMQAAKRNVGAKRQPSNN
jgi:hypothetical protein